jgi:integrase
MGQSMTLKEIMEAMAPDVYENNAPARERHLRVVPEKPRNPNHPKKGDCIRVDPIRDVQDIERIKAMLSGHLRDLLLFTLGINTNLRASDLVALTVGQVRGLKPMEELELRERKTSKMRRISLNETVISAIEAYIATLSGDVPDTTPLFASQRCGGSPLMVPSVNRMVKGWCRTIKLKGNYGSHSLRKTWGYHQRVTFGVDIPSLMVCFNHSTQRQTLDYLCVQPEEVKKVYSHQL